jgi:DNA-binding LacI/PurR family transcriptional regulator
MTLASAAKQIGVSAPLISMVLGDRWRENRVSQETRDRVLQQLEEINFRPNRLAQSIRNKSTGAVGVLVPNIRGSFYQSILSGIEASLGEEFIVNLGVSEYSTARERQLIVSFLERRADGLILVLAGDQEASPLIQEIRAKEIPLVLVDREHPREQTNFVGSAHVAIGEQAATHILDAGYRCSAFLHHVRDASAHRLVGIRRLEGFQSVMRKRGDRFEVIEEHLSDPQTDLRTLGVKSTRRALEMLPRPFCVFCMDPNAAIGILAECREQGIDVPNEVGILTVDALEANDLLVTPLTMIRQQTARIGTTAAGLLMDMIQGRQPVNHIQRVELDTELIVRRSTQLGVQAGHIS